MRLIFITGINGSGKTVLAHELAKRLGIVYTSSTDAIRAVVRQYITKDASPMLHAPITLSHNFITQEPENIKLKWRFKGKIPEALYGFYAQADMLRDGITAFCERDITEKKDLILEGTHLIPNWYPMKPNVNFLHILVTVRNKEVYLRRIAQQSDPMFAYRIEAAERSFTYQDHLVKLADIYNVSAQTGKKILIVENEDIDRTVSAIASYVERAWG